MAALELPTKRLAASGQSGKVCSLGIGGRFGSEHGSPLLLGIHAVFGGGGDHAGHFLGAGAEESARKLAFFVVVANGVALDLVAVDRAAERDQIVYVAMDILIVLVVESCISLGVIELRPHLPF